MTAQQTKVTMDWQSRAIVLYYLISLMPPTHAQNVVTKSRTAHPNTIQRAQKTADLPHNPFAASSTPTPASTDDAPKGNGNNNNLNSTGLVNYYFVFIALILAVIGMALFCVFRRRHKAMLRSRIRQQEALQQDLGEGQRGRGGWANWNPERRRHWQGRWRSAEASREEGLNEYGEAPPAYVPKRQSEERQQSGEGGEGGPAVPLQTLSREDAGLKPPDYSETYMEEITQNARRSSASAASASSSRPPDRRTST